MDTSSIVIGLILLLIFIGPIGYLLFQQKNAGKKRKKKLEAFAQRNQITLAETENLPSVSLGLAPDSRKLVVVQHGKNGKESLVDLISIKSCEVFDAAANGYDADNMNSTEEVRLILKGKPDTPDESILFFHEEMDSIVSKEERMRSATQWSAKIRELVRK